jgi:hypothetical protein
MLMKRMLTICLLVTFFYLGFPSFAHAYLDPGTGSYIFQLLIAGIVGLAFLVKVYWKRIKLFLAHPFSKDRTVGGSVDEDEEDKQG